MNHSTSHRLYEEAKKLMPGGVNSPVRSFRGVGGEPLFIMRGRGSHIWDADNNEYIDYVGSWGPLILGHAHPSVVLAVREVASKGTSFGAPTPGEVELARLIHGAFPSVELVRLVSSGTEACMSAIRVARAFTGRSKLVKFNGCYHGHADSLLVKAGSGGATFGVPDSAGVPAAFAAETLVAEYNDLASVERLLKAQPGNVAAVIVEPVAANMGVVPPKPGFLEGLRRLTTEQGALLIFDEVITGFRVAWGGAQALYSVTPDLTCLGKVVGGGMPLAAYGGRRDVMERVAPLGPMYQAGTLSGNPVAVAAGIATLKTLQLARTYERLEDTSAALEQGLRDALRRADRKATINRVGSVMTLFFNGGPVNTWADVERSDTKAYAAFFHGMLDRGVYLAPSAFEAAFVSLAHGERDLEVTVEAARQVLAVM
ncbi:MAG: glutamate-1-semialdehyde-2,1-aminomutase [Dehalococcoidia bacterium]|nr:glutamate-1-semialdehyde-2,1-aminomutase [Dehalococcoidia bacterium]